MSTLNRKEVRRRIHARIRRKISGTSATPRLAVHFSNRHVYAQVIDDTTGKTVCAASTHDADAAGNKLANVATAVKVGTLIAQRAAGLNITAVVFDRGGHKYHGKVKALADAARQAGLKF